MMVPLHRLVTQKYGSPANDILHPTGLVYNHIII